MNEIPEYILFALTFGASLLISMFSIPQIMYVAKRKHLFDEPDNHRKIHKAIIPNLGGVGIFFAFIISTSLFIDPTTFTAWNYIAAATLILFLTGIKDDLVNIGPGKKFLAQFAAAFIVVFFADIRVHSLEGLLGIYELPYWASLCFTVIGCMFVTNAFNLIDGIDGLAGSIGALCSLFLGLGLALEGHYSEAVISFSLMGAIMGFLRYNISPARIFMGDTGALVIGFTISLLSIQLINGYSPGTALAGYVTSSAGALALVLSLLFVPVFDTFRVFATRIMKGHSPFRADRTHLHHYLLDLGYGHSKTVLILIIANLLIIGVSLSMQTANLHLAVGTILLLAFGLFTLLFMMRRNRFMSLSQEAAVPVATEQVSVSAASVPASPVNSSLETSESMPLTVNGSRIKMESAPVGVGHELEQMHDS